MAGFALAVLCLVLARGAQAAESENCDADYPKTGGEGRTTISARIPLEGNLRDAVVLHSSGDGNLDKAAVACAGHTFIRPPTANGAPSEITWTFDIVWLRAGHSFPTVASVAGNSHLCRSYYPQTAVHDHAQGTTTVSFVIEADGTVSHPMIAQSSANPDLDAASLNCINHWLYPPPMRDGKPVSIGWRANVNWSMH